jgi:hypothetical protein
VKTIVLSASRRTDIPAFYMPWFMEGISRGDFEVLNPYSRKAARVPATTPPVHTIVFWSKNFGPFIHGGYGPRLQKMGYHLFFQFTLTSEDRIIEPHVPPLAARIEQLRHLCGAYGPRAVNWRFDPVCFFRRNGGEIGDNLDDVVSIAEAAAAAGIRRCTVSVMDHYRKIGRRTSGLADFAFVEVGLEEQAGVLLRMEALLAASDIRLFTCCEKKLLAALPAASTIQAGACIPSGLLMELFGGELSLQRDTGQRIRAGCECRVAVDIGSYHLHPCGHGCLYCYANPTAKKPEA